MAAASIQLRFDIKWRLQECIIPFRGRQWYLYNLFSYAAVVVFAIGILAPIQQWNGNIIYETVANAHITTWVAVLIVVAAFGYNDIIKGVMTGGMFMALHEFVWLVFFFGTGAYLQEPVSVAVTLVYYGVFAALLVALVFAYWAFIGKYLWPVIWKTGLFMAAQDMVAYVAGVNIMGTTNLGGPTVYIFQFIPNLVETLGWFLPAMVFVFLAVIYRRQRTRTQPLIMGRSEGGQE